MHLTDKQQIHRDYLQSPLWQAKRLEALAFYGPICARCRRYGSDIHHKTYERVGGAELMEDFEILCRGCHEAHHRIERCTRARRKPTNSINATALARYLTARHRDILTAQFGLKWQQVYAAICDKTHPAITAAALKMLGKKSCYIARKAGATMHPNLMSGPSKKHHSKLMS